MTRTRPKVTYKRKVLRPFFSYYGSKFLSASHYPQPLYDHIIESFAGSACYSLHYYENKVTLYDVNPIVAGIWEYLIRVRGDEIMHLPLAFDHVDDIKAIQEAKWLIGFWINAANVAPQLRPSRWMTRYPTRFWCESIRQRIASQVDYIRHWKIKNETGMIDSNEEATWFIDPPYHKSGKHYPFGVMDYTYLANWCRSRMGQVIVCENAGADWLEFEPFMKTRSMQQARGGNKSDEVMWSQYRVTQ